MIEKLYADQNCKTRITFTHQMNQSINNIVSLEIIFYAIILRIKCFYNFLSSDSPLNFYDQVKHIDHANSNLLKYIFNVVFPHVFKTYIKLHLIM